MPKRFVPFSFFFFFEPRIIRLRPHPLKSKAVMLPSRWVVLSHAFDSLCLNNVFFFFFPESGRCRRGCWRRSSGQEGQEGLFLLDFALFEECFSQIRPLSSLSPLRMTPLLLRPKKPRRFVAFQSISWVWNFFSQDSAAASEAPKKARSKKKVRS